MIIYRKVIVKYYKYTMLGKRALLNQIFKIFLVLKPFLPGSGSVMNSSDSGSVSKLYGSATQVYKHTWKMVATA